MAKKPQRGVVEAAGGLVWRETEQGLVVAIVFRPRYKDWTLPKGHLKSKETWQAAALREVEEETGCRTGLDDFIGCTSYMVQGIPKIVLFWNMHPDGQCKFEPNEEVDRVEWATPADAMQKLRYENERRVLREAAVRKGLTL